MAKCKRIGCTEHAIDRGRCKKHSASLPPLPKRVRREYHNLYNTSWWKKTRKRILATNPLCVCCNFYGKITAAVDVDHCIPHRGDKKLFFDYNNLVAMCKKCHSNKTAEEQKGLIYDYRSGRILDTEGRTLGPIQ